MVKLEIAEHNLNAAVLDASLLRQAKDKVFDQYTQAVLELESLKKKIIERAEPQRTIRAKTTAEVRRLVEQENEREAMTDGV